MTNDLPTVVLVHDAFANASCWIKLVPLLQGSPPMAS